MASNGYLCVVFNPGQPDLVKVLKTSSDPQGQVQALSAARQQTLMLLHQEYFENVDLAEEFVQGQLSQKYYPVKPYWDLKAPLHEVIQVVNVAKQALAAPIQVKETMEHVEEDQVELCDADLETELNDLLGDEDDDLDFLEDEEDDDEEPGQAFYDLAEEYYYGSDDVFQDYKEAMKLYKKAAEMGHTGALFSVGMMYSNGEGVRENQKTASEYFTKGAQKGDIFCMEMLTRYYMEGFDFPNWGRCWKKIFRQIEEQKELYLQMPDQYVRFITDFTEQFSSAFLDGLEDRDPSYLRVMFLSKNEILEAYDYSLRLFELLSNHVMATEANDLPPKERAQLKKDLDAQLASSRGNRKVIVDIFNAIQS